MFTHTGPRRTFLHNLRLAIVLSATAGFVNAAGLVAFDVLTTNITGHAAILTVNMSLTDWRGFGVAGMCLILFFAGALFSSWYINLRGRNKRYAYTLPLLIEAAILMYVAFYGDMGEGSKGRLQYFTGSLLFAMGMQNALVTVVSRSVVRTTHLTGIMTDFGIAVADAIRKRFRLGRLLKRRLLLHISIIFFFLLGGMFGVYAYQTFSYYSFLIPAGLVLFALFFDTFRMSVLMLRHRVYMHRRRLRSRLSRS